jgi:hypothetical protein
MRINVADITEIEENGGRALRMVQGKIGEGA